MRQFLRILFAACIIAFATSMLAVSCGKTADPNNNANTNTNTNTDGGSGGDGNGGGNAGGGNKYPLPTAIADPGAVKIINVNTSVAKVDTTTTPTTIRIKASALINTIGGPVGNALQSTLPYKVFDITNEKAKEGMVLVGKGNVASADKITTGALVTAYSSLGNDGISMFHRKDATDHGAGKLFSGVNFVSTFASTATPTDSANNTEPFAFTKVNYLNAMGAGPFPSQPYFFCGSGARLADHNTVAATDKLTGGHKGTCAVTFEGSSFRGDARAAWLTATAPFKHEILVAIAAIKTDDWKIADLLSDGTAAANVSTFTDGISATEMKRITDSNSKPVAFEKFIIKIVNDTDFAAP